MSIPAAADGIACIRSYIFYTVFSAQASLSALPMRFHLDEADAPLHALNERQMPLFDEM